MSKTKSSEPLQSWGTAYVLQEYVPNNIIGRILTITDVLGLNEKQEKAFRDLVTQSVWDAIYDGSISISIETHNELREKYYKMMDEARTGNTPPSLI